MLNAGRSRDPDRDTDFLVRLRSSEQRDLAVIVEAEDLLEVATFVSEKLSTIGGVLSTATRFQLKAYKEGGFNVGAAVEEDRLLVSP